MRMNISVPDEIAAEVRRLDIPTSAVCQRALREEVGRLRAVELGGMGTLTVHVGASLAPVRFTGRWLVDPDADRLGRAAGSVYFGVALTGRGRIAILTASDDLEITSDLRDYDNLNQAAADGVPAQVISGAAMALGQDPAVWRDI